MLSTSTRVPERERGSYADFQWTVNRRRPVIGDDLGVEWPDRIHPLAGGRNELVLRRCKQSMALHTVLGPALCRDQQLRRIWTVSFALMRHTVFVVTSTERRVDTEIGAGDDNWDFNSSTVPSVVNGTVAALVGPDHYNLTGPIKIRFRGVGKRMVASRQL